MKAKVLMPALVSLILGLVMSPWTTVSGTGDTEKDPITIYSSPDLMPVTQLWIGAYGDSNPGSQLQIKTAPEAGFTNEPWKGMSVAFLSEDAWNELQQKPGWKMVVGRDVVVPVLNAANPYSEKIAEQGISSEQLARLFENPQSMNWSSLLGPEQNAPLNFYTVSNSVVQSVVAGFLNLHPSVVEGTVVDSEEALIASIAADPHGMGFCRVSMVPDQELQEAPAQVVLMPIDKNGNGTLDYHEQIYGSMHAFMRGVWIGKYPRELVQSIYMAASEIPSGENMLSFLKWAVTDGQQFLRTEGHSALVFSERHSKLDALRGPELFVQDTTDRYAMAKIILVVLFAVIAAGWIVNALLRKRREANSMDKRTHAGPSSLNENTVDIPGGLYYDKTHTWVFMDKSGCVKIGVDDFLQHITGDFTRVDLKKPGDRMKKHEPVVTLVQDGKKLVVHAPVSGTIKAVNEDLMEEPSLVNSSPYDRGWVYLVEPSNWQREIQFLKMAVAYKDWLKIEFTRLKDFLAAKVNTHSLSFAQVALQDGGELSDHLLEKLGPEVWEEFQKHFVETIN